MKELIKCFLPCLVSLSVLGQPRMSTNPIVKHIKTDSVNKVVPLIKGTNINTLDPCTGFTFLIEATNANASKAAAFLIKQGADIHKRNVNYGRCPGNGSDQMWSLADGPMYTPLMWSASYSSYETAEILIKAGANVNDSFSSMLGPQSVLFIAVYQNDLRMADLLLSHGADILIFCDEFLKLRDFMRLTSEMKSFLQQFSNCVELN